MGYMKNKFESVSVKYLFDPGGINLALLSSNSTSPISRDPCPKKRGIWGMRVLLKSLKIQPLPLAQSGAEELEEDDDEEDGGDDAGLDAEFLLGALGLGPDDLDVTHGETAEGAGRVEPGRGLARGVRVRVDHVCSESAVLVLCRGRGGPEKRRETYPRAVVVTMVEKVWMAHPTAKI